MRKCVFVVGEDSHVAEELGLSTLPKPRGSFIDDVDAAVEALRRCRKCKIVIKGGTPYEIIVAASAAFIEYRRCELTALNNPSLLNLETATLHALGTGETYKIRKKILELIKTSAHP